MNFTVMLLWKTPFICCPIHQKTVTVHTIWDVAKTSARDHCKQYKDQINSNREIKRGLRDFSQFKSLQRSSGVHVKKKNKNLKCSIT